MKEHLSRRQFVAAASVTSICSIASPIGNALGKAVEEKRPTWLQINNVIYGAKPDKTGQIGGSKGYIHQITKGDFVVENLNDLITALAEARAGQVVFIPSGIELDLTSNIYIEKLVLKIPEGVTLAGDRGYKGSLGALMTSDTLNTPVMIQAMGPNIRVTGLRIRGPHPKRYLDHHARAFGPGGAGHTYYYKFPVSMGITTQHSNLEVDNCELSAFARCAIGLFKGKDHHIHHNFIHQCQYNGLGYGVSHDVASSTIEYNLFNENRHSIAGTGKPGCSYIARHNVELGISLSHCFDMHGGRDRKDQTDIAGTTIEIYSNTFFAPQKAVTIRGVPEEKCDVHHNWFVKHRDAADAVKALNKTVVWQNAYGEAPGRTG
jgi:hypothetical protein